MNDYMPIGIFSHGNKIMLMHVRTQVEFFCDNKLSIFFHGVNSKTHMVTSLSSRICWLGLSKILREVKMCARIHRIECVCVYMGSVSVLCFAKK